METQPPTTDAQRYRRSRFAWYVVHARPFKEQQVAQLLHERLELEVYLPFLRQRLRNELHVSPFFAGYLFIKADLSVTSISAINTTPGVLRIVIFGNIPQPVPVAVMDELRLQVDEINDRGGALDRGFEPGATVRLKHGPLCGLEGTFLGPTTPSLRVRVLIEFLGQLRETELDAAALDQVGVTSAPARPRRTRGRARPINSKRV